MMVFGSSANSSFDTVKLLSLPVAKVPGLASTLTPLIEATAQYLIENPTDRVLEKAEAIGLEAAARFYAIPGAFNLIQHGDQTFLAALWRVCGAQTRS
jgi:hypothetical protein